MADAPRGHAGPQHRVDPRLVRGRGTRARRRLRPATRGRDRALLDSRGRPRHSAGLGGIPRLVREIGPALTKELVLTCRPFDASEAKAGRLPEPDRRRRRPRRGRRGARDRARRQGIPRPVLDQAPRQRGDGPDGRHRTKLVGRRRARHRVRRPRVRRGAARVPRATPRRLNRTAACVPRGVKAQQNSRESEILHHLSRGSPHYLGGGGDVKRLPASPESHLGNSGIAMMDHRLARPLAVLSTGFALLVLTAPRRRAGESDDHDHVRRRDLRSESASEPGGHAEPHRGRCAVPRLLVPGRRPARRLPRTRSHPRALGRQGR